MAAEAGSDSLTHVRFASTVFDNRLLAMASSSTLVIGAVGLPVSETFGWECPSKMAGFVCPGCGCGGATRAVLSEGLGASLSAHWSALLLLFALVVSSTVSLTTSLIEQRTKLPRLTWCLWLTLALSLMVNWFNQLASL